MKRREFIALVGGIAATWPVAVRAQQPIVPSIGVLYLGAPGFYDLSGFRQGLKEANLFEGQNLVVEYRWANGDANRLPELADDLVSHRVLLIVPLGSSLATGAAKGATATIPIVFGYGGDPVRDGLVESINRPGGNVTGVSSLSGELGGKRLGLLHELLPGATRFAMLVRSDNPTEQTIAAQARTAAATIGGSLDVYDVINPGDIDDAFDKMIRDRIQALLVGTDTLFATRRTQVVILAARHAVPTMYPFRDSPQAGGLMSYGPNLPDRDRYVGLYVGRILRGEKPADLPVMQSSKFEFVINLQTARTIGIDIPATLLARTDEVIE